MKRNWLSKSVRKGMKNTITILQKALEGKDIADKITESIIDIINKDEDVKYSIHGFKKKYGIEKEDIYIAPLVGEDLIIEKYALCVDEYPVVEGDSFDDVVNKITAAVLNKDESLCREIEDIIS